MAPDNKLKRTSLASEEVDEFKHWRFPTVEAPVKPQDSQRTNAFNRKSEWKYEPPEEEEAILPPTAEEIEAIRQAAYDEGFAQGKEAGYQEGLETGHAEGLSKGHEEGVAAGKEEGLSAAQTEVATMTEQFQTLMAHLHQPVDSVDQQLEQELVGLAVALARAVIRTEVQSNDKILLQALSEGLKALPIQEQSYQIRLHPDDMALIKSHYSEEELEKQRWHLIENPEMNRGGVDILTESNAVDVSIERRVRDVLDKFLLEQGLEHLNHDPDAAV